MDVGVRLAAALLLATPACSSFGTSPSNPSDASGGIHDAGTETIDAESALDVDIAARWAFDEGSGSATKDAVGRNDGNLVGSVTWVAGHAGAALGFTDSAYVDVPLGPSLAVAQTMTFAAWVNFDDVSGYNYVYAHGYTFTVRLNGGRPQFLGSARWAIGAYTFVTGQWHHLTITFDRGVVVFYIDGLPIPISEGTFVPGDAIEDIWLGTVKIGAEVEVSEGAHGMLDDVRLWRRVLTPAEIASLVD
jgi:hypothetical protein